MIWIFFLLLTMPSAHAIKGEIAGHHIRIELPLSEPAQFEAWAEGINGEIILPKRLYHGMHAELPFPSDYAGPLIIWAEMAYCDCNITLAHVLVDIPSNEHIVIKSRRYTGLWAFSLLSAVFCAILIWKR